MAKLAGFMLKRSLDALVHMDAEMAESVQNTDSQVNEIRNEAYSR